MITVRDATSLTDFDFDRLYASSLPYFEAGTVKWPDHVTSAEDRKAFVAGFMSATFDADNFRYVVLEIDGLEVMCIGVSLEGDTAFVNNVLMDGDQNGSRAYYHSQEYKDVWMQHLLAIDGITKIGTLVFPDSPLRRSHDENYGLTEADYIQHGDTFRAIIYDADAQQ